jgi:AraC-like DNA-binding protein
MVQSRAGRASSGKGTRHAERHRIERAIELYLARCYRGRTVARVSELAIYLGVNRTHLSRVVSQVIGEPLGAALRRRQLTYAATLLRNASMTVSEVAAAAAFGTQRTFFRAFRRAFGMTPGVYRENATK